MLIDSMSTMRVEVNRAIVPTSMHIANDPNLLQDPASFPVQVSQFLDTTYSALTKVLR